MNRRLFFNAALVMVAGLFRSVAARKRYTVKVLPYRCVGCRDCLRVCPSDAVEVMRGKAGIDAGSCTGCLLCVAACSYGAIERCEKEEG
jgi:ferredoxin